MASMAVCDGAEKNVGRNFRPIKNPVLNVDSILGRQTTPWPREALPVRSSVKLALVRQLLSGTRRLGIQAEVAAGRCGIRRGSRKYTGGMLHWRESLASPVGTREVCADVDGLIKLRCRCQNVRL
jgi:hypothetical protein